MNPMKNITLFFPGLFILYSLSVLAQDKNPEELYKKAIIFFDSKKNKEGFELLDQAIGLKSAYYDAVYARSYYLVQEGKYPEAIRDYDSLVKWKPEDPNLLMYRGQALMYAEQFDKAETDFLLAYEKDSNNLDFINSLGSLYYLLELYEDALLYFEKATRLNPKDNYAFYYRAYSWYYLKKYDKALKDLEICIQIDPKDPDLQRLKARVFIAMKQYKNAIAIYEALQKKDLDFESDDFLDWAYCHYQLKRYEDALFYLELPEEHQETDIFYLLAKTKYQLNKNEAAKTDLDSAIAISGENNEESAKLFYDRAAVLLKLKKNKEALDDYLRACYLMPEIYEQKNYQNEKIELLTDLSPLLKPALRAGQIDSVRVKGYEERALAFISVEDGENANLELQKALAIDSLDSGIWIARASAQLLEKQYEVALESIERAKSLTKNRSQERIHFIKGLVYSETGKFNEAIQSLEEAIRLNAKEIAYFTEKASVYYRLGNFQNALTEINKAIRLLPEEWELYNDRALYHSANLQFDKALEDCNRVLSKDQKNITAYYNRAIALSGLKKYDEAIADFNKVLETYPEDKDVWELKKKTLEEKQKTRGK